MAEAFDDRAPYDQPFKPESAHGSAVRLLTRAGVSGVVLDVGCGYGPVAEPLREAGFDYVGLDLDAGGVADLESRGFAAGHLDLGRTAEEIESVLRSYLSDRRLGAVLALDVLEHLADPAACLQAITSVARDHPGACLVVSLPNVTHVDLVGKLLLGRWEITEIGLLDRTHVQFFDARRAVAVVAAAGWRPIDGEDVETEVTEQCEPSDAPQLRPGSPLNDLLRDIRARADGHGVTYQFVRAYTLDAASLPSSTIPTVADESFALVVVGQGADLETAVTDLAAQVERSFVVLVVAPTDATVPDDLAARVGIPDDQLRVIDDLEQLHASVIDTPARYVCRLGPGERVGPMWLREFAIGTRNAPGRLLVASCTDPTGAPLPVATFDLAAGLAGVVPPAAYAVPRAAAEAGAMRYGRELVDEVAGLARTAMWSGRYDLLTSTCSAAQPVDLGALGDAVGHILDANPIVLAPGAAGPLVALQRELVATRGEIERVRQELNDFRHGHDVYAAASDADRAALQRRLAQATTPWGAALSERPADGGDRAPPRRAALM